MNREKMSIYDEAEEYTEQSNSRWIKKNPNDKVWWLDIPYDKGTIVFSFNKKDKFYLYRDYPQKLTKEQKEIFDKENPFWKEYFGG